VPRPEYTISIEWACDPARTAALVRRVFDEIQFVKDTSFTPDQVRRLRAALLHDFEQDSQDNGYLLNEIARATRKGRAHVAAVVDLPDQIAALTGEAIQEAARTYLDTANYVKVTLMPETK
jgi:predicted Zn-dependent peptidase